MDNKKFFISAIIVICVIIIISIFGLTKKQNSISNIENLKVEDYVREHYLNFKLLDYLIGDVTPENKMAYTIDEINEKQGSKQKEIQLEEVKNKYLEIFAENLEVTEAAFMLPNGYEYEQSRNTFLNKQEEEQEIPETTNIEQQNNLEITGARYDKSTQKYIVTIVEKSGKGENAITIRTTNMELKSNENGNYIITEYSKAN